jgi:hypothetical protein
MRFEILDELADGRPRQVQLIGRPGKRPRLGDADEDAKGKQLIQGWPPGYGVA